MVDDRSPHELPKKPSCGEAGISTTKVEQSATVCVGLGRSEVKPVEQSLVDDRSSYGLPKKASCDVTGISTTKG